VYISAFPGELVPTEVVTVTWTVVPAVPGGVGTNRELSLPAQNDPKHGVTVADPNATLVAPVKPLPTIWTMIPPDVDPVRAVNPLTTGGPTGS
jgi:hypothetical protein